MGADGVNGASRRQVHVVNHDDMTNKGETSTVKHATREVKFHLPTKKSVLRTVLDFVKKFLDKSLFSRKVELQESSISPQVNKNHSYATEVNNHQSDVGEAEDHEEEKPAAKPILKEPKEEFGTHSENRRRDPKVTMNENAEVHGQDRSGYEYEERTYNAELRQSRGMENLGRRMNDACVDMAMYVQIKDAMEKRDFDKTLLKDKSSAEVLKILKANKLITKQEIKLIKNEKIDLEGSPYW